MLCFAAKPFESFNRGSNLERSGIRKTHPVGAHDGRFGHAAARVCSFALCFVSTLLVCVARRSERLARLEAHGVTDAAMAAELTRLSGALAAHKTLYTAALSLPL